MVLITERLQKELEEKQRAEAANFTRNKIFEIAQLYYNKMKDVMELWILFAAKRDVISGNINLAIHAFDRDNRHIGDFPRQGCQFWYTNQKTGEARLEWILPFSNAKRADHLEIVSGGSRIIKESFKEASQKIGRDLLTGKNINK